MSLSQRMKGGVESNAETFNAWLNKAKDEISENHNEEDEGEDDSDFER
jgi:hypothetical protein